MSWKATLTDSETIVTGTVQVPNAAPDEIEDLELMVEVNSKGSATHGQRDAVVRLVKELEGSLQKVLSTFHARLKEQ